MSIRPRAQLGSGVMQLIETKTGLKGRQRSIARARLSFDAALPRTGRLARQCRRALLIGEGVTSMKRLREWCYPQQQYKRWHKTNIYRALHRLNAKRISYGIWALYVTPSVTPEDSSDK